MVALRMFTISQTKITPKIEKFTCCICAAVSPPSQLQDEQRAANVFFSVFCCQTHKKKNAYLQGYAALVESAQTAYTTGNSNGKLKLITK